MSFMTWCVREFQGNVEFARHLIRVDRATLDYDRQFQSMAGFQRRLHLHTKQQDRHGNISMRALPRNLTIASESDAQQARHWLNEAVPGMQTYEHNNVWAFYTAIDYDHQKRWLYGKPMRRTMSTEGPFAYEVGTLSSDLHPLVRLTSTRVNDKSLNVVKAYIVEYRQQIIGMIERWDSHHNPGQPFYAHFYVPVVSEYSLDHMTSFTGSHALLSNAMAVLVARAQATGRYYVSAAHGGKE